MPLPQQTLRKISQHLSRINHRCGESVAWLTLAMVIISFIVVVLRYWFNVGWIALQESVTYMHGLVFMLGASYTLAREGHVRVDIFYNKMSPRQQAWVNITGTLFLLIPLFTFILWICWDYVWISWQVKEGSADAGGLPILYLLKTVLLLMPLLMLLQGCALLLDNILTLADGKPSAPASSEPN